MTSNWKPLLFTIIVCGLMIIPAGCASDQNRQLYGFVYGTNGQPISGAIVSLSKCSFTQTATTGSNGSWSMVVPTGVYGFLTFSANGFHSQTFPLELNADWPYAGGILSLQPAT